MADLPALPEGFTLDAAPAVPALPDGFTLDAPAGPDKYQQAAIDERNALIAKGITRPEGYTRRATFGPLLSWGDEAAAAMTVPFEMIKRGTFDPREAYRYTKAREDLASKAARENTGLTGDVVELGSALAVGPSRLGGTRLAAALGGGAKGIPGAVGRMAGYGVESAALGAIQGAGAAENVSDIPREALTSGAISGAIGAPFGIFGDVARRSAALVPAETELMRKGAQDARALAKIPASYDLQAVGDRMSALAQANRTKYGRDVPNTVQALRERASEAYSDVAAANALNPNPGGSVTQYGVRSGAPNPWTATATPRDINSLRREIYDEAAKGSATDERAGYLASRMLGRVVSHPDPAMLAPGVTMRDAIAAAGLEARRRGNFGAAYRSKAVTDQVKKTIDDAATANSGLNFENRLRQNINSALKKGEFDGFNASETADLTDKLIRGAKRANTIREISNMLGGGGGIGRSLVLGGGGLGGGALGAYQLGMDPWTGAVAGLAGGLTGRGLRVYGNRVAKNTADAFAETLRKRSPEYASRLAAAPMVAGPGLSPTTSGLRQALTVGNEGALRDAIVRALIYQTTGERRE